MSAPQASGRPDRSSQGPGGSTAGGGGGTPVPVVVRGAPGSFTSTALLLAGPLIWTLHFAVVYLVAEAGCTGDGPGLASLDPPLPVAFTIAATVVAALACAWTALLAHRRWRGRREHEPDHDGVEPVDHQGSLAFVGYLLSLLGVVTVVFVGVPALVLGPC